MIPGLRNDPGAGLAWCRLCGSAHDPEQVCPRSAFTSEPEQAGRRIGVETPRGVEGYGVLLVKSGARWRARIVTFPNVLWMVPGGGESIKFLDRSREGAERGAVDFIRRHCLIRGYTMRDEVQFLRHPTPERRGGDRPASRIVSPRYHRCLPVRFGRDRPVFFGETFNLSESGLFINTDQPMPLGESVGLSVALEYGKVPLRANVAWQRVTNSIHRPPGMGLELLTPPSLYLSYVQALG